MDRVGYLLPLKQVVPSLHTQSSKFSSPSSPVRASTEFLIGRPRKQPSMACGTVPRILSLAEPRGPLPFCVANTIARRNEFSKFGSNSPFRTFTAGLRCSKFAGRRHLVNCSNYEAPSSFSADDHDQGPPQEAVLKAISEVSKTEGRVGHTTNVVIGGTVADDSSNEWLALDQKVNSYPTVRGFTAIGTGGDDFVQAMVVAVESVIQQPIPEGRVKHKLSSRGKYVSVNIGPVQVVSSEQVQAVYNAMRRDDRMKYFL